MRPLILTSKFVNGKRTCDELNCPYMDTDAVVEKFAYSPTANGVVKMALGSVALTDGYVSNTFWGAATAGRYNNPYVWVPDFPVVLPHASRLTLDVAAVPPAGQPGGVAVNAELAMHVRPRRDGEVAWLPWISQWTWGPDAASTSVAASAITNTASATATYDAPKATIANTTGSRLYVERLTIAGRGLYETMTPAFNTATAFVSLVSSTGHVLIKTRTPFRYVFSSQTLSWYVRTIMEPGESWAMQVSTDIGAWVAANVILVGYRQVEL